MLRARTSFLLAMAIALVLALTAAGVSASTTATPAAAAAAAHAPLQHLPSSQTYASSEEMQAALKARGADQGQQTHWQPLPLRRPTAECSRFLLAV